MNKQLTSQQNLRRIDALYNLASDSSRPLSSGVPLKRSNNTSNIPGVIQGDHSHHSLHKVYGLCYDENQNSLPRRVKQSGYKRVEIHAHAEVIPDKQDDGEKRNRKSKGKKKDKQEKPKKVKEDLPEEDHHRKHSHPSNPNEQEGERKHSHPHRSSKDVDDPKHKGEEAGGEGHKHHDHRPSKDVEGHEEHHRKHSHELEGEGHRKHSHRPSKAVDDSNREEGHKRHSHRHSKDVDEEGHKRHSHRHSKAVDDSNREEGHKRHSHRHSKDVDEEGHKRHSHRHSKDVDEEGHKRHSHRHSKAFDDSNREEGHKRHSHRHSKEEELNQNPIHNHRHSKPNADETLQKKSPEVTDTSKNPKSRSKKKKGIDDEQNFLVDRYIAASDPPPEGKIKKSKKSKNTKAVEEFQTVQEFPAYIFKEKHDDKLPSKPDLNSNTLDPNTVAIHKGSNQANMRNRLPSYVFEPQEETNSQEFHTYQVTEISPYPNQVEKTKDNQTDAKNELEADGKKVQEQSQSSSSSSSKSSAGSQRNGNAAVVQKQQTQSQSHSSSSSKSSEGSQGSSSSSSSGSAPVVKKVTEISSNRLEKTKDNQTGAKNELEPDGKKVQTQSQSSSSSSSKSSEGNSSSSSGSANVVKQVKIQSQSSSSSSSKGSKSSEGSSSSSSASAPVVKQEVQIQSQSSSSSSSKSSDGSQRDGNAAIVQKQQSQSLLALVLSQNQSHSSSSSKSSEGSSNSSSSGAVPAVQKNTNNQAGNNLDEKKPSVSQHNSLGSGDKVEISDLELIAVLERDISTIESVTSGTSKNPTPTVSKSVSKQLTKPPDESLPRVSKPRSKKLLELPADEYTLPVSKPVSKQLLDPPKKSKTRVPKLREKQLSDPLTISVPSQLSRLPKVSTPQPSGSETVSATPSGSNGSNFSGSNQDQASGASGQEYEHEIGSGGVITPASADAAEENSQPSIVMTDKGAIRFQLPGRITHKTTIKVAHYPEANHESVVINVPNQADTTDQESCSTGEDPCANEQVPCDPMSFFNNQNYGMNPQQYQQYGQQQQLQQYGQHQQLQQYGQQQQLQQYGQQQSMPGYGYNYPYGYNPYGSSYPPYGYPPC